MAKKRQLRVRNLKIIRLRVRDILESESNIHSHPVFQKAALSSVVDEIGWYGYPDVYVDRNGKYRLCDGHLRRSYLESKYGLDETVEVNLTDFDENDSAKAMLTKDRMASLAEYDAAAIRELSASVSIDSLEMNQVLADVLEEIGEEKPAKQSSPSASVPITASGKPERRYPVSLVLRPADWKEWIAFKKSIGVASDSDAFVSLFDSITAIDSAVAPKAAVTK